MVRVAATRLSLNNMVINGDFEFAPPFTAPTTTTARFIDGTAGGSTNNNQYNWSFSKSGTASAQFDSTDSHSGSNSLKLSTLATASYVEVFMPYRNGTTGGYNGITKIPCLPSTSYTLTYWMKTNVTSGVGRGASLSIITSNAAGADTGGFAGTEIATTTGWTQYTVTFTTAATARFIQVNPRVYGHTPTGTLIMDAWFDDIVLGLTTPVTRSAA